jgi:signal transduction histidine kinase
MVETEQGQTWLVGSAGIVEMDTRDFERAFDNAGSGLKATVFGFDDGLPGVSYLAQRPAAARGGDGRLWFALLGGVAWIDPSHLHRNMLPPLIAIRSITANGVSYSPDSGLVLSKGVSTVSIAYSGLSLSAPQRVRYKYRLLETSPDWVDAGSRREVNLTNLAPGSYTFQVIAANSDGIWSSEGKTLTFSIQPTFLQSIWFKFVCALLLGLGIWLAYAFRVRQLTSQLHRRFELLTGERERIARELHDTLLQSVQGLMLRFQSVANRIPVEDPMRTLIEDALDRAEAVVIEGRRRVRDLRSDAKGDFFETLVSSATEIMGAEGPQVQCTVEGKPRPLHPLVEEEALRVAEEAMRNAAIHANASAINLLLTYDRLNLRLSIRDDGVGMPSSVLTQGGRNGHYGLLGMRERALRIGGCLEITSRERAGTQVALTVPAGAAYRGRKARLIERVRKTR